MSRRPATMSAMTAYDEKRVSMKSRMELSRAG